MRCLLMLHDIIFSLLEINGCMVALMPAINNNNNNNEIKSPKQQMYSLNRLHSDWNSHNKQ